jgi:hypothetical protein
MALLNDGDLAEGSVGQVRLSNDRGADRVAGTPIRATGAPIAPDTARDELERV